jgi:hypothetical protein
MNSLNAANAPKANGTPPTAMLQRKCACGSGAEGLIGECSECRSKKSLAMQSKLAVGRRDDPLEREADQAAEQVMAMRSHPGDPDAAERLAPRSGTQREAASPDDAPGELSPGQHPVLSRRSAGDQSGQEPDAPASVQHTLDSTGDPLPEAVRAFFEPRFGHDFGRVRVHHDPAAARSAHDVNASAYTVGKHIVFGAGSYAPGRNDGRSLIAHELAHVVQQGAAGAAASGHVQRRGFFAELAGLFAGDDFDEPTLMAYLDVLRQTGHIEDNTDSDNKARAVVKDWKEGDSPYVLTEDLKALLIREMMSGFTGDDDEQAILELLERSYNFELAYIFGTGGVTVAALNSAFQGMQQTCLEDFFTRRFAGGEAALARGTVEPQGDAVRFGDEVQTNCAQPVALPGFGVDWSLPCVLGILCSEDRQVIDDLTTFDVQSVAGIDVDHWQYDGTSWSITETRHPVGAADAAASPPEIRLLRNRSCEDVVRTVVHEVRHQNQAAGSRFSRERDAYIFTEQWTIDRGLPGYGHSMRTTDPQSGAPVVNIPGVETYVQNRYPGTASATETIVDHRTSDGFTEVSPVGGANFFRPPQAGDSHWGAPRYLVPRVIGPAEWVCPGPQVGPQSALPPGVIRQDFNDRILESTREI